MKPDLKITGAEALELLGDAKTKYPETPEEAELEIIPNQWQKSDYVVKLDCHEFTCLCPKTAQPDFARLQITYIPAETLVESKALKLYLFAFRNTGIFHEFVVNYIANELYDLMKPKYLQVEGIFMPRGGIAIQPKAILGDRQLAKDFSIL